MKLFQRTLWLLLLWLVPLALKADQFGDFGYTTNGGAVTITNYTGGGGNVTVPANISTLPVTSIGIKAFYQQTNITSVVLPDSVLSIKGQAFAYCSGLIHIAIPDNVITIEIAAFYKCFGLTNVIIPKSIASIGDGPFAGCTGLTHISVDTQSPFFSESGGVLFDKNQTTLIQCPGAKAGKYVLQDGVTNVGAAAFYGCAGLTNIVISTNVLSVGNNAFVSCSKLASISLPESLKSLGNFLFGACTNLAYITIPSGVTNIGTGLFDGCQMLQGVFFKGDVPNYEFYVFFGVSNVVAYCLPGKVGWGDYFDGATVKLWNPVIQTTETSFGVQSNQFGFNITGTTNIPIVVEVCTNLAGTAWTPLQTCTVTNGSIYFSDAAWTNYPGRIYRIRSP